jgi:predicted acetylornithine/succinylornithine family transaminase
MNTEQIKQMHETYVMPTYSPGLALVRGEGCRVWDADGREYLDFLAGISVLNVGHCHPKVVKAIQEQAAKLMHVSNLYFNEKQPELAKVLSERSLQGKCFFCNSGAEANEGLIKLARLWGRESGRYEVMTMKNSFHGRTLATLTATGQDKVQKGFEPLPEGFVYGEFNNLEACRAAVTEKTAAILVEAVQGEGGIVPAETDFLIGLKDLCEEHDMLLLFDEVQCGLGRTGRWFGYQRYDVEPDAMSLAKALGGGFPMGAIVTSPRVSNLFQPGHHATTFGGTPLACAAGLAVVEAIEDEGMVENAARMGVALKEGLEALAEEYEWVASVRGWGLMLGMVLDRPAKRLQELMQEEGLIVLATAQTVIRLLPPLNIGEAVVEEALEKMEQACGIFDEEIKGEKA